MELKFSNIIPEKNTLEMGIRKAFSSQGLVMEDTFRYSFHVNYCIFSYIIMSVYKIYGCYILLLPSTIMHLWKCFQKVILTTK